jgi:capsular polysaccharide transport system ATP-binding protein
MIILDDVTSAGRGGAALEAVNIAFPSDRRIALLGPSDQEKQLLIEVLAGVLLPTKGRIVRNARLSFPVGQLPGFNKDLTLRVNIAHVARLYGADVRGTLDIVEDAFGRAEFFDRPYANLPRERRQSLFEVVAFAPFDTYLLTDQRQHPAIVNRAGNNRENTPVFEALFAHRLRTAGFIVPTNDLGFAREHCDIAIHLGQGRLELVEDMEGLNQRFLRRRNSGRVGRILDRAQRRRRRLRKNGAESADR